MLTTALTIIALGGGTAQRMPDQLDVLRGVDRTPQIKVLIDMSGSMLGGSSISPCDWYVAQEGLPVGSALNRIQQLTAVLTGCRSSDDGIFDRWASQIVFSVDTYEGHPSQAAFGAGINIRQLVPFPTTLGAPSYATDGLVLETAINALPAAVNSAAGTPLAQGYRDAALTFDNFTNSNTEQCRQNAIIVMSDGVGNGTVGWGGAPGTAPVLFNQAVATATSAAPPGTVSVFDASSCYQARATRGPPGSYACDPGGFPPHLDDAAEYLYGGGPTLDDRHDLLSQVDGVQPIRTYTIGFNAPSAAQALLEDMAAIGGGSFYDANTYEQLSNAFDQAIYQINSNADASFTGITVQGSGIFSGNYVYQSSYQGSDRSGHWFGNLKKYCIFPETPGDECVLADDGSGGYVLNTVARDLWTSTLSPGTRFGGAGEIMLQSMNAGSARPATTPPAAPFAGRNIVTWRPNVQAYVDIETTSLGPADTFSLNDCRHYSLVNKLFGYTFDTTPDATGNCLGAAPVAFDAWPMADTVNGGQVLLKYTDTCENAFDRCYLVTVSNLGMLHIYNAITGVETQAIVAPYFLTPNPVANHILADILDQPTVDFTRRFYFDGGISLYHTDEDGDGVIDATPAPGGLPETAAIIVGLGRGGRGYVKWDVTNIDASGQFTVALNPPQPLTVDGSTGFQHLQDTWAAPWTGTYETNSGRVRPVAIFPSGHIPELDDPAAPFAQLSAVSTVPSGDTEALPFSASCADMGIPAEICSTPSVNDICTAITGFPCGPGSTCTPCNLSTTADCTAAGLNAPYCYNWPGLAAYNGLDLSIYGISSIYPLRINAGPYFYTDGPSRGIAYRLNFSRFDLQPNDVLIIYNDRGIEVQRISGSFPGPTSSAWVRSPGFSFRIVTNGVDDAEAYGITLSSVDVVRDVVTSAAGVQRPTLFMVDLEEWNGDLNGFVGIPPPSESRQARGILTRFVSDCRDTAIGPDEECVDSGTSGETSDLQYMTCPITAEPSVYTEGGLVRAIYFGDTCGQIWSMNQNRDATGWTVRRLLSTNRTTAGTVVSGLASRNYRKIFTKSDIVISTCTGRRAIGVYFGTGNIQRPAVVPRVGGPPVLQNLEDPAVTRFPSMVSTHEADVVGVVWDEPTVPTGGYTLDDLANVTDVLDVDPTTGPAQAGLFLELAPNEKMLRNPLVLDGVAFFQTYEPTRAATECDDAIGRSFNYAFDNCTAAPVRNGSTAPADRRRQENDRSLIGSEMSFVVDEEGRSVLLSGDPGAGGGPADMRDGIEDMGSRGVRLFLWRVNVD